MNELLEFAENITGKALKRIDEDLGYGYVRLNLGEAERRQAKHDIQWVEDIIVEILRNSRDAGAQNIFIATKKDLNGIRQIVIVDDGCGIPEQLKDAVFQPRVTSKLNKVTIDSYGVHGRGMALFSIANRSITSKVHASILDKGTVLSLDVDTSKLPERKDQSAFPKLSFKGHRKRVVNGPKNVLRTAVEFALDNTNISVYCGSPIQVASTFYSLDRISNEEKLWKGLSLTNNAIKFKDNVKEAFNLDLSERSCYRVLVGEIIPLRPLLAPAKKDALEFIEQLNKPQEKIKIPKKAFVEMIKKFDQTFNELVSNYYLKSSGQTKLRISGSKLNITMNIEKDQANR